MFIPVEATCGACGHAHTATLSASVNADRRPDLRDTILGGTFQSVQCPACSATIRLPAHITYIDMARRQWLLVEDAADRDDWRNVEAGAAALFEHSFGPGAPAIQRAAMEGVRGRLVFGWPALREKLIAADADMDDITLELLKISVLRNVPNPPFADDSELRLLSAGPVLELGWLQLGTERFLSGVSIPRSFYDDIADSPQAWAELRHDLSAGLFVDMARLVFA